MHHTCDTCTGSKSRRALKALLEKLPNITTAKAARQLDISRPYLATIREQMEVAACVPTRTIGGRTQMHTERAMSRAKTWSNTPREMIRPLLPTLPGEVEHLLSAHVPNSTWGYPIGSWWSGVRL